MPVDVSEQKKSQPKPLKKPNILIIFGALLIITAVISIGLYAVRPQQNKASQKTQDNIQKSIPKETDNWLVYQSAPAAFLIKYPQNGWEISPNDISGVLLFNLVPPPGIEYTENIAFKRQGAIMPTQDDLMYITVWKTVGNSNAQTSLQNTLNRMSSVQGFSGGNIIPITLDEKKGYKITYSFVDSKKKSYQLEQIAVDWSNFTYILSGGKSSEFDNFVSTFKFVPSFAQIMPPLPQLPCEDGVLSWQIENLCSDGGSWTGGSYACTDGTSGKVSSPTCTTADNLRSMATKICAQSPKTCPPPSISPTQVIGPNLSTLLKFKLPDGWDITNSDASQIVLQSADYNYSNYGGGGKQQGEEITITRNPNTEGNTLDMYKSGPFKSFASTSHDGLPAFVGIVSFAGLPNQPNNLVYDYIIIKKGYIWDIRYIFYSPNSKKGPEYQQKFNNFLDNLHLN